MDEMLDRDLAERLSRMLARGQLDEFFELIHAVMTRDPDATVRNVLSNPAETESKLRAMRGLINMLVGKEDYERCAPLRDMMARVEAALAEGKINNSEPLKNQTTNEQ